MGATHEEMQPFHRSCWRTPDRKSHLGQIDKHIKSNSKQRGFPELAKLFDFRGHDILHGPDERIMALFCFLSPALDGAWSTSTNTGGE